MVTDEERKRLLIQKHKPMTKKDVQERFQSMRKAKSELTTNATILEQNLKDFNLITDPLIDPETNKVLCWIRRPTTEELEALVPAALLEYRNKPDEVPEKIMKKYKDFQFKMMANLIEIPKKSASWWKTNANMVFQQLFQLHLRGVMEDLGIMAENF